MNKISGILRKISGILRNKRKGFLRVATILSVIWLIGLSLALSQWERFGFKNNLDDFIGWGVLPLIIFWYLVWKISVFRN